MVNKVVGSASSRQTLLCARVSFPTAKGRLHEMNIRRVNNNFGHNSESSADLSRAHSAAALGDKLLSTCSARLARLG